MDFMRRLSNLKLFLRKDYKSFIRSILVLLLAVMLVFCSTFAWIEGAKNADADGDECTVTGSAGLQFSGDKVLNNTLTFDKSVTLVDCSSKNGKNFFFSTTGSIRKSTESSSETSNIVFRKGVEEDKNSKYLTEDFIVSSLETKGEGKTDIFISTQSSFVCSSGSNLPFRISLDFNDGTEPIVICPGLTKSGETRTSETINSIDGNGTASTTSYTAHPMCDYYYGLTPVYSLPNGESRVVTVTVWVEGTDSDCTVDNVSSKDISMNLILTTEDSNMRQITFVDYSPSSWVQNDNATMYVVEEDTKASYRMNKSSDGITYVAQIPDSIKNVYFQRTTDSLLDPSLKTDYNSWSYGENDDLEASTTYYAIGRGAGSSTNVIDGKNYGYWVNSNCTNMLDIYLLDEGNILDDADSTAYPYLYIFDLTYYGKPDTNNNNSLYLKSWNGFQMEKVGYVQDTSSSRVYHLLLPADSKASIIFNGKSSTIKTTDIPLSDASTGSKINQIYYKTYKKDSSILYEKLTSLTYIPSST